MSEWLYYEFQAIDRRLNKEEQQASARLSSRRSRARIPSLPDGDI